MNVQRPIFITTRTLVTKIQNIHLWSGLEKTKSGDAPLDDRPMPLDLSGIHTHLIGLQPTRIEELVLFSVPSIFLRHVTDSQPNWPIDATTTKFSTAVSTAVSKGCTVRTGINWTRSCHHYAFVNGDATSKIQCHHGASSRHARLRRK
jgi:hypothetical protein